MKNVKKILACAFAVMLMVSFMPATKALAETNEGDKVPPVVAPENENQGTTEAEVKAGEKKAEGETNAEAGKNNGAEKKDGKTRREVKINFNIKDLDTDLIGCSITLFLKSKDKDRNNEIFDFNKDIHLGDYQPGDASGPYNIAESLPISLFEGDPHEKFEACAFVSAYGGTEDDVREMENRWKAQGYDKPQKLLEAKYDATFSISEDGVLTFNVTKKAGASTGDTVGNNTTAANTSAEKKTVKDNKGTGSTPNTGDNSPLLPLAGLATVAAGALAVFAARKHA